MLKKNTSESLLFFLLLLTIFSCKKSSTPQEDPSLPILSMSLTGQNANVDFTQVTITAEIFRYGNPGFTSKGICWSTSSNPTISDNKKISTIGDHIFITVADGLIPGTQYYFKAYATNSLGTAYSNEIAAKTAETVVTDIDGNTYNVIKIITVHGLNTFWLRENLKASKFRNGDIIPTGFTNSNWSNLTTPGFSVYNNDMSNDNVYGKLYNSYAVNDSRGICPNGYHIPNVIEWDSAVAFFETLTPLNKPGGAMKTLNLWQSPNTGATNASGFTALPAGKRYGSGGIFAWLGSETSFWSSTIDPLSHKVIIITLSKDNYGVNIGNYGELNNGHSCRCIRN